MLKIIKKSLFLSLFIFSFVLPIRQVVRVPLAKMSNQSGLFRNSLAVRCPIIPMMFVAAMVHMDLEAVENEAEAKSTTGSIAQVAVMDPQGNESKQPLSHIEWMAKLDASVAVIVAQQRSALSSDLANFSTIIQRKTSRLMKDYASFSNHDLRLEQKKLAHDVPLLKNKCQSLIDEKRHLEVIFNQENYDLSFEFLNKAIVSLIPQDFNSVQKILDLKLEIASVEAIVHAIDCKLTQEANDLKQTLNQASLEELEAKIIPELKAKEAIIDSKNTQAEHRFNDQRNCLKKIAVELHHISQRSAWHKFWEGNGRRDELLVERSILEAAYDKMRKEELPSLQSQREEIRTWIKYAESVADQKRTELLEVQKLKEREAFEDLILQEQREENDLLFYDQQLEGQYDF